LEGKEKNAKKIKTLESICPCGRKKNINKKKTNSQQVIVKKKTTTGTHLQEIITGGGKKKGDERTACKKKSRAGPQTKEHRPKGEKGKLKNRGGTQQNKKGKSEGHQGC